MNIEDQRGFRVGEKTGTPIRVLHLDDCSADAELVAMALELQKTEFPATVQYVQNQEQFLAALSRRDFDMILSDYRMPGFDGEHALKAAQERCPEIPFIMVTGELGEERVIETLQRGATDYVLKDRIFRLIPAMKRALEGAEIQRKRREVEEALRISEERFSAAFRASPDPYVISKKEDGTILDVNEAFLRLFGMERSKAVGRNTLELNLYVHPPDREEALSRLRRDGNLRNYEMLVRSAAGEERCVLLSAEQLELEGGPALVSVLHDVTEQKRAEEALRESEQRLRATFNNAALGIVEADVNGRFLAVNDRICSILAYSRDELLRMTVHELTAPQDRAESDVLNARLLSGEIDLFDYEKRYLRRDGSPIWVHLTVSAVRDAAGKVVRAIGTVEDISARKKAEEKLKEVVRMPHATRHEDHLPDQPPLPARACR